MTTTDLIKNENKAFNKLIGELEDIQARLSKECMILHDDEKIMELINEAREKTLEVFGKHAKYLSETPVTLNAAE